MKALIYQKKSAQQAELIALTLAFQLAKDQLANIYTDSCNAFWSGTQLWNAMGTMRFLTSSGQPKK